MLIKPPSLPHILALAALTCASAGASADSSIDRARQRGSLLAGVDHVAPEYVATTKFRTPESIATALVQDVSRRLRVKPAPLQADAAKRPQLLASGDADVVLAAPPGNDPLRRTAVIVPTGYAAAPMAIMRTDTDIKSWDQLKGRTVCLSGDGRYAGTIAAQYGAVEKVFKAPADSLLALRTGKCDAAVHDDVLLEELLKLPEWKKFSARLPAGQRTPLVFAVPARDPKAEVYLKQVAAEWQASGMLAQLVNKQARSIAFEVYLDQDVPDCH
ncbi:transporter substrate-binding domain-containing protein [Noviherbaspirillum massiliense]|uniref:transporter substrate-binding domain-containing protein n=1 Tax=Noviherbaspirillum massiliense TaxID=1465823 RepID=UPI0002E2BEDE|nr:transporter substrate-binding domain-containing protein [Noviherbaspirillum massiliense]